ncbi:developmental protein, partial [Francisella tularensis subsp. holarctica]|nr:developmental protein [Francisella tularensis subsp. holarctica]
NSTIDSVNFIDIPVKRPPLSRKYSKTLKFLLRRGVPLGLFLLSLLILFSW